MKFSIAMPTYKRLPFLKKAVASVFAQTWTDWELVISDDEKTPGETWTWLQELAAREPRVKILRNEGARHGQVFNVNNALRACTGEWIKPLFDDDRMLPNCLSSFAEVIAKTESHDVVLIGSRAQMWRNGQHIGDEVDFSTHAIDVIPQKDALLAMCRRDLWNGKTPTHCLMNRTAVFGKEGFCGMVEDGAYKHQIDVRWFGRLLERGALAMTNKVLVCECQGECESGTSTLWKEEGFVSEEARRIYCEIWDRAEKDERWPSRRGVDRMICGLRGLYHVRKHQFALGLKYLALMALSLEGTAMTRRWLRQKRKPQGGNTATKRIGID